MRCGHSWALGTVLTIATAAFCSGALPGCGDNRSPPMVADDSRRNVMVIDDGIDLTAPWLTGKVAAAFTVHCDPASQEPIDAGGSDADDAPTDGGAVPDDGAGSDFATTKAQLIAELGRGDESCHLRAGIDAKTPLARTLESKRANWNRALLDDDNPFAGNDAVAQALDADLDKLPFHGTATAGAIAFKIPHLNMVLVEEDLSTEAEVSASFGCPTQESLDLTAALLSDPDVRAAFLAQPQASIDRELVDLRTRMGVTLVNESFGPISRYSFELMAEQAGCGRLMVNDFFHVVYDLTRTYDQAHADANVLFVRAAGNDGAALNNQDDGAQCHPGDAHQLLIGAYGQDGKRSIFTNSGACVDAYAPGEAVVVPLPGDWLVPLSGTSFSAPLTVRLLLFLAPTPITIDSARRALFDVLEPNGNVPQALFPKQLLYDVRVAAMKSRLTAAASPQTQATTSLTRALRPSARAVRRALWPLRWVGRHRL